MNAMSLGRLGLALGLVLALPAAASDLTGATVVATVNGAEITLAHMQVLREQLPDQYKQLPDDILFNGILEQLIQQTALAMTMEGRLTRRDELALENSRRAYLASQALMAAAGDAASDEKIAVLYAERVAGLEPERQFNASHILVATQEEAQALKAQIDAGADFAELARLHSTDGAAQNGGELGWFGLGMMVQAFEEAVLALEPGQVSDPVQTQFGWHLVRLNETRMAELPTLEEMTEELASELQDAAIEAHIAAATGAAAVVRTTEGIDPAVLRDQNLVIE
ncbi:MAG: peptidylprolyl isomerase [Rhodobacteraceae bacterium]|jgi:peptidyl-prolyl cis-trans isomerase C|nr:peptidylprolyl isomerase [Paracoccaceae bacterium]